jgi:hypothetical protein
VQLLFLCANARIKQENNDGRTWVAMKWLWQEACVNAQAFCLRALVVLIDEWPITRKDEGCLRWKRNPWILMRTHDWPNELMIG